MKNKLLLLIGLTIFSFTTKAMYHYPYQVVYTPAPVVYTPQFVPYFSYYNHNFYPTFYPLFAGDVDFKTAVKAALFAIGMTIFGALLIDTLCD